MFFLCLSFYNEVKNPQNKIFILGNTFLNNELEQKLIVHVRCHNSMWGI